MSVRPTRFMRARLVVCAATAALGAMAGCGGGGSAETDVSSTTREPATTQAAPRLDAWTTASTSAPAREDAAAASTAGHVYLVGGKDAAGHRQATVYVAALGADGVPREWEATTPLPEPREDHNAVTARGRLYVIGGGNPDRTVFSAQLGADARVGPWRQEPELPTALDDPASAVAGDYLFVMGGLNDGVHDVVYWAPIGLDGALGEWRESPNRLPDGGRAEHTAFVANGRVYVIGGGDPEPRDGVFSAPLTGDGGTGAWRTEAERLPAVRLDHTTAVVDGVAFVIGGIDESSSPQQSVFAADLRPDGSLGPWRADTPLPSPREDAAVTHEAGGVYVIAGKGPEGSPLPTVLAASLASG